MTRDMILETPVSVVWLHNLSLLSRYSLLLYGPSSSKQREHVS